MIARNSPIRHLVRLLCLAGATNWAAIASALTVGPEQPAPVIILGDEAKDQERFAAEDLRRYLQRITGKKVEIANREPSGTVLPIYLGELPQNSGLKPVVEQKQLGRDGFVLQITPTAIHILGGSKFGTSYGAYELLERLGVRWLFPGEWGEVVPEGQSIPLDEGIFTDQPAFPIRQMHVAYVDEVAGEWFRRSRHNRCGYYGHSRLLNPKKYGAQHPEWYAEINGVRQVDDSHYKLCHSNEAMVQAAIGEVLEMLKKRKENQKTVKHIGYSHLTEDYTCISISPTDGGGFCRCEKCLAMGSISDRLQIFANRIAKAVREVYPDDWVGYYGAYSEAQMPPTVEAEPGVMVFATTWTKSFFHPITAMPNNAFRQKLEAFSKQCPNLAIRDFDGLSVWWGYGPFTMADVHAEDFQWYLQNNIRGIITEAQIGWAPWGYSYYLLGKLWWNPKADLAALKRDFVEKGYAEAAEPMRRYYEKLDQARVYPSAATLYAMRQDLEEAAKLAKRSDVVTRIDALRTYYYLGDLLAKLQKGETVDATLFNRLMASGEKFALPFKAKEIRKWLPNFNPDTATPLLREELRELLAQVELAPPGNELPAWRNHDDIRLQPLHPDSPSQLDQPKSLGMSLRYGPTIILIHAKAGERIHVTQQWKRGDEFKTAFELYDPELSLIRDGLAKGETILDLPAPSTGVYTLTVSPGSPYPEISVSCNHAVVKAGSTAQRAHIMGKAERLFIYVPKGTKEFAIATKAYEPLVLKVNGPVGAPSPRSVIEQHSRNYEEHRFTVGEGEDGQPWQIQFRGGKKDVYLIGIPPFMASGPERLLVTPEMTNEP